MSADEYLKTPEWSEFTTETVCGRRVQVWRRRLTQVTELLDVAATAPDLDLVVQADRRISSADFLRTVRTGAAQLAEADIGPADRVLIVLHNSPEFLLSMWSTWGAGAVPVLGNRWWSERELDEVTRRLEPTLVITDMSLPSDLAGTVRVLAPDAVQSWWDLPAADPVLATGGDEDDVALILFTAGSTGVPKGVQQSHRVILATQQTLHVMRGGRPPAPSSQVEQGVTLLTTPLFHNGGIVSTISALLDGNRTVLTKGRFDPAEVVELIERERVMSWQAVPPMFQRVLDHPDAGKRDLSSLRAPSSGGTVVPAKLIEEVPLRLPGAVNGMTVGYGMTEGQFVTMAFGPELAARPGTVGRPIPGVEVSVADPDTSGEGELLIRSALIMVGYFGQDDQPVDAEGWYHSGDLGRIDDDGYVYITGRVKDMVIRGGENIACPHVESVLAEHDAVREVAVFGVPHEELGEELAAVIVPRSLGAISTDELAGFARERLAHFEVPTRWLVSDEQLPTLPTGKFDKVQLRERLQAETL